MKEKAKQLIDLSKLNYSFIEPPLLVSGVAMMYHGLRESDKDIDMILSQNDHINLAKQLENKAEILEKDHKPGYKDNPIFVDLYDDHGILIYEYELWDSIMLFDYKELSYGSVKEDGYNVIGLEKLMMLSTIRGVHNKRYLEDALLIAKRMSDKKYKDHNFIKNEYWHKFS